MDAYRSGQFNLDQLDMIITEHDFFYITKDGLNSTCVCGGGSKSVTPYKATPSGVDLRKARLGGYSAGGHHQSLPGSCSLLSGNVSS